MYGTILGDIIGSPFEFDRGDKTKDFPLFSMHSGFTDDTVMTLAVADALMDVTADMPDDQILQRITGMLRWHGRRYPNASYAFRFAH